MTGYDAAVWYADGRAARPAGADHPRGVRRAAAPATWSSASWCSRRWAAALLCSHRSSPAVVLAGNALLHSGASREAKAALLRGHRRRGDRWPRLALAEAGGRLGCRVGRRAWRPPPTGDSAGAFQRNEKMFVTDGGTANLFVVAARCNGGIHLFTVEGDAAGLSRENLATMDQTRKQARLDVRQHACEVTLCGAEGGGWAVHGAGARPGCGGPGQPSRSAARSSCLDMAVQYAKDRVQFGRPDRVVPGHQAQVRRHAAGGGVGEVGRLLRRPGAPRS